MGDVIWMHDLTDDDILVDFDNRDVVVTKAAFERISDYTRSHPTSPSVGRIFRKNFGWPEDMPDHWAIYICEPDDEPGMVRHVPYEVILV